MESLKKKIVEKFNNSFREDYTSDELPLVITNTVFIFVIMVCLIIYLVAWFINKPNQSQISIY